MNEKDKIIEVINSIIPGRNVFYGDREYTVGDIADELIKNGIGDVSEWKKRAEVAERNDKIKERALKNISRKYEIMFGMSESENDLEEMAQSRFSEELKQAEHEIEEESNDKK